MTRYILRRLLIAVPVLWGIVTLTFIMSEIMPGDYVDALVPPNLRLQMGVDTAQLQRLRESYGLDKPVIFRYGIWLRELMLHGNLGYSFITGQPALQEMAQVLPATLQLSIVTILFSLVVGTTLGIISAIKQYSVLDHFLTLQAFVWISTPGFVFAIIALYLFSLKIPLFPTGGRAPLDGPDNILVRLHYLALPALILGFEGLAGHMRYARASLLDALGADYVRTARARACMSARSTWATPFEIPYCLSLPTSAFRCQELSEDPLSLKRSSSGRVWASWAWSRFLCATSQ